MGLQHAFSAVALIVSARNIFLKIVFCCLLLILFVFFVLNLIMSTDQLDSETDSNAGGFDNDTASASASSSRSSSAFSTNSTSKHLKEMAVDAIESMRSRPKDRFSAMGEYYAGVLRSLPPDQATFTERKLNRAFCEILEEATMLVSSPQMVYVEQGLGASNLLVISDSLITTQNDTAVQNVISDSHALLATGTSETVATNMQVNASPAPHFFNL